MSKPPYLGQYVPTSSSSCSSHHVVSHDERILARSVLNPATEHRGHSSSGARRTPKKPLRRTTLDASCDELVMDEAPAEMAPVSAPKRTVRRSQRLARHASQLEALSTSCGNINASDDGASDGDVDVDDGNDDFDVEVNEEINLEDDDDDDDFE